jgi:high-affinity iron transporter
MLQILIITMREGIEAFLIVAITAGILRQTGRAALLPAVYTGTGLAVVVSFIASMFFAEADNKPLWEGVLAAAAAVMVISMTVYMWRAARTMRATIGARLDQAMQQGQQRLLAGALLGVGGAVLIAWAWTRYGRRINLPRFFKVTAIFLLIFSVQLVIYTFHELFEAGAVPYVDNEYWHIATEPYGPEGLYGQWLTYLMVLVPAAWLLAMWLRDRVAPVPAAH